MLKQYQGQHWEGNGREIKSGVLAKVGLDRDLTRFVRVENMGIEVRVEGVVVMLK